MVPAEQATMKTDQIFLICQERKALQGNEFQEAEHANEFIIPARFGVITILHPKPFKTGVLLRNYAKREFG